MIIIGHQGIGKSSIAKHASGYIDLESGNFWVDGKRDDQWYIPYCNIAVHLSEQGYWVFTASHEVIRKQLRSSTEQKLIVCPAPKLKDAWIRRLDERYKRTQLEKDHKAMMNAKHRYTENIQELLDEEGYEKLIIDSIPFDLKEVVEKKFFDMQAPSTAILIGEDKRNP